MISVMIVASAVQLESRSPIRADGQIITNFWAALPLLALATPVSAANAEEFDWKRCTVEVMPASSRALVVAQQSLIDGNGFTPDHHDPHKKLELACGYEIRQRTGEDPGYFRPRVLYRYLRRHIDELVGDDQIEPSFVLFQLLDPRTSPPTFMGHRTYIYMDDALVGVYSHPSTTCWVGRDLKVNQFTGDLPPAGPAIITRVHWFDIRAAPPAQARRVGRFHLAGTPGALVPVFGSPRMSAA